MRLALILRFDWLRHSGYQSNFPTSLNVLLLVHVIPELSELVGMNWIKYGRSENDVQTPTIDQSQLKVLLEVP